MQILCTTPGPLSSPPHVTRMSVQENTTQKQVKKKANENFGPAYQQQTIPKVSGHCVPKRLSKLKLSADSLSLDGQKGTRAIGETGMGLAVSAFEAYFNYHPTAPLP